MHEANAVLGGFEPGGEELCDALGASCEQVAAEQAVPLDAVAGCGGWGDWVLQGFCELRDSVEKSRGRQWPVACGQ